MFMYSLTLQPPTAITQAIVGQFAGTKEQQIITASGSRLTLHRPDPSQGKIITTLSHDVFGIIRAIAAFRLAGSTKGKLLTIVTFMGASSEISEALGRMPALLHVTCFDPCYDIWALLNDCTRLHHNHIRLGTHRCY